MKIQTIGMIMYLISIIQILILINITTKNDELIFIVIMFILNLIGASIMLGETDA